MCLGGPSCEISARGGSSVAGPKFHQLYFRHVGARGSDKDDVLFFRPRLWSRSRCSMPMPDPAALVGTSDIGFVANAGAGNTEPLTSIPAAIRQRAPWATPSRQPRSTGDGQAAPLLSLVGPPSGRSSHSQGSYCHIQDVAVGSAVVMYASYFALFSHMFIESRRAKGRGKGQVANHREASGKADARLAGPEAWESRSVFPGRLRRRLLVGSLF